VPLKLVGTQRFYERREIRDVLAYLKFLYNPDDNVSAIRLINVPPRGIGAATIKKLEDFAAMGERSIGSVLLSGSLEKSLTPAVSRKVEPLQRLLMGLMTDARAVGTLAIWSKKFWSGRSFSIISTASAATKALTASPTSKSSCAPAKPSICASPKKSAKTAKAATCGPKTTHFDWANF
jgi:hypothetical protein